MKNVRCEQLVKRVEFTIFLPGNKLKRKVVLRAPAGKGYGPKNVDEILVHVAGQVEKE